MNNQPIQQSKSSSSCIESQEAQERPSPFKRAVFPNSRSQSLPIAFSSNPNHSSNKMSSRSKKIRSHHSFPFSDYKDTTGQYQSEELLCTDTDEEVQGDDCWKVSHVKIFPSYFTLEHYHEYISNKSANEIARNISHFLKVECLEVEYDHDEAVAHCETSKDRSRPDYCSFQVRLFKASSQENYKSKMLVEVQRKTGCCMKFSAVASKILSASKKGCCSEDAPAAAGSLATTCKLGVQEYTIPDFLLQRVDSLDQQQCTMAAAW